MEQHPLDRLVWDSTSWVAAFNDLLDALEVQFAVEDELREEIDGLKAGEDL